jgi:hypothetical protein
MNHCVLEFLLDLSLALSLSLSLSLARSLSLSIYLYVYLSLYLSSYVSVTEIICQSRALPASLASKAEGVPRSKETAPPPRATKGSYAQSYCRVLGGARRIWARYPCTSASSAPSGQNR